jgi:5-methylcytosine-specific restriction endonuclease McrA
MKNHTKVYLQAMGYDPLDFIPCEVCGAKAVDIHHIQPRGMGGSKLLDTPENLMALCRSCHHQADFGTTLPKEELKQIHERNLHSRRQHRP